MYVGKGLLGSKFRYAGRNVSGFGHHGPLWSLSFLAVFCQLCLCLLRRRSSFLVFSILLVIVVLREQQIFDLFGFFPQRKASRDVAHMELLGVKDGFQVLGISGIRPYEGLKPSRCQPTKNQIEQKGRKEKKKFPSNADIEKRGVIWQEAMFCKNTCTALGWFSPAPRTVLAAA